MRLLLIIAITFTIQYLNAYYTEYNIRSLGLNISKISIEHRQEQNSIKVRTKSLITNRIFPRIDNEYSIIYENHYLPISYIRNINQDSNVDSVSVRYSHSSLSAVMSSAKQAKKSKYHITSQTRDLFSFLMLLANGNITQDRYVLDGNGRLWNATLSDEGSEVVRTKVGTFKSRRYRVTFEPQNSSVAPYIDMVTHNLLNQDSIVTIWISDSKIAVKAVVRKKLLSMNWELTEYRN